MHDTKQDLTLLRIYKIYFARQLIESWDIITLDIQDIYNDIEKYRPMSACAYCAG